MYILTFLQKLISSFPIKAHRVVAYTELRCITLKKSIQKHFAGPSVVFITFLCKQKYVNYVICNTVCGFIYG